MERMSACLFPGFDCLYCSDKVRHVKLFGGCFPAVMRIISLIMCLCLQMNILWSRSHKRRSGGGQSWDEWTDTDGQFNGGQTRFALIADRPAALGASRICWSFRWMLADRRSTLLKRLRYLWKYWSEPHRWFHWSAVKKSWTNLSRCATNAKVLTCVFQLCVREILSYNSIVSLCLTIMRKKSQNGESQSVIDRWNHERRWLKWFFKCQNCPGDLTAYIFRFLFFAIIDLSFNDSVVFWRAAVQLRSIHYWWILQR